LSYRLGGDDGVAVEARKWEWALRDLGFVTRRVAGEFDDERQPDDIELPFLSIDADPSLPREPEALTTGLAGADLVVVENLCSLPLNRAATQAAAAILAEFPGRVLLHHHDLPWERPELGPGLGLPPALPGALHVTISDHARSTLAGHGIPAVTIRNAFDTTVRPGDRRATREQMGFDRRELVVLQPTRAIPRKGIRRGLALAEQLNAAVPDATASYWLTGPAEDGYGPALDEILGAATVKVTRGRTDRVADAYAAADLVVVPSSWEGFGNPVVEAMLAELPVACATYPVLDELLALGLEVLSVDDLPAIVEFIRWPDTEVLQRNRAIVTSELSLNCLPIRLAGAFVHAGWDHW
jgi:glycosyltransferase involved in cell wall biosynthesis